MKRLGDRRRPVIKSADTTRNDFHDQTLQEDEDDIKALREQVKSLAGTSPSAGPTPGASHLPPRDDATGLADIGDSGFSADVEDSSVTGIQTGKIMITCKVFHVSLCCILRLTQRGKFEHSFCFQLN